MDIILDNIVVSNKEIESKRRNLQHLELKIQSAISIESNNIQYSEVLINRYKNIYGASNILEYVNNNNLYVEFDLEVFERLLQYIEMNPKYREYKLIGFNLCAKSISRLDIVNRIKSILDLYNVDANMLVVEINEASDFENDKSIIKQNISRLKKLGFKTALDDFGTERASLKVLMDYDFDIVKIDKGLIDSEVEEEESTSRILLQCIARVIKLKKQKSIIEGVETKEQLKAVSSLGYDSVQGFIFSKPEVMI